MKFSWRNYFSAFFLLFIIFFPTGVFGEVQQSITRLVFGDVVTYLSHTILGTETLSLDFSSDSISMYLLVAFLLMIALAFSFCKKTYPSVDSIVAIYLAVVLLRYGFDKLFKSQFYLPEPNILYSRLGDLDRDILFWSVMGTSHQLSVILGFIEIVIAMLLLIPKTMRIGGILAFFTFLPIFLINVSFDISVKLFSFILLGMTFFITFSVWKKLGAVLFKMPLIQPNSLLQKRLFLAAKIFLVLWTLWLVIPPVLERKSWNDDLAERPLLHGVYRNLKTSDSIKYVFVHRDNYLIFKGDEGELTDYKFKFLGNQLVTTDSSDHSKIWTYSYSEKDSILALRSEHIMIEAKAENWRKMKALRPLFHLTVDQAD